MMNLIALYVLPFVLAGAVIARNWLREMFQKATRVAALVEPRTRVLLNAAGATSAPEFYPPLRLLKRDDLCGRCRNPAHEVGFLDPAGLCEKCVPIVASFRGHQQGSLEIAVRVLPFPESASMAKRGMVS